MTGSSNVMTIDLTNYKDRVGGHVAEGRYRVMVEDVEPDESKAKNPMINVWLRVVGGPHDGATIIDRLVLTDKSMFRVVGFMQAIGLPTPKKKFTLDIRKFLNRQLLVDVEDGEPYNGKVKSEVRGYMKLPADAVVETMTASGSGPDDLPVEDDLPPDDLPGLAEFAKPSNAPLTQEDFRKPETPAADQQSRSPQAAQSNGASVPEDINLDELNL